MIQFVHDYSRNTVNIFCQVHLLMYCRGFIFIILVILFLKKFGAFTMLC